ERAAPAPRRDQTAWLGKKVAPTLRAARATADLLCRLGSWWRALPGVVRDWIARGPASGMPTRNSNSPQPLVLDPPPHATSPSPAKSQQLPKMRRIRPDRVGVAPPDPPLAAPWARARTDRHP